MIDSLVKSLCFMRYRYIGRNTDSVVSRVLKKTTTDWYL